MITKKTIENLEALKEEYLQSLTNAEDRRDDWYDTPRGFAQVELNAFLTWLKEKKG
jgi:hypothetical protein